MCIPRDEMTAEWSAVDPDSRRALGATCVGLATLVLLILACSTLQLLPGALDSESWRGPMIVLGIQTAVTILPWYFAGIVLLRHSKSRPPAVLRVLILLNIPLQVLFYLVLTPEPVEMQGAYEFGKFVNNAILVQAVLAMTMAFILHALWLKQKDHHH